MDFPWVNYRVAAAAGAEPIATRHLGEVQVRISAGGRTGPAASAALALLQPRPRGGHASSAAARMEGRR